MLPTPTALYQPPAVDSGSIIAGQGFNRLIIDNSNQQLSQPYYPNYNPYQYLSSYYPYPTYSTYSTYQPSTATFIETKPSPKIHRSRSKSTSKRRNRTDTLQKIESIPSKSTSRRRNRTDTLQKIESIPSKSKTRSKDFKIIREAPPVIQNTTSLRKNISIEGKRLSPPSRRVVLEKIPAIPALLTKVHVDRWLAAPPAVQKITVKKAPETKPAADPKNLVIEWTIPDPKITQKVKYLGVEVMPPSDYIDKYSSSLIESGELPEYVKAVKSPEGFVLASDAKKIKPYTLVGDLKELAELVSQNLLNLGDVGLEEYKDYLMTFL